MLLITIIRVSLEKTDKNARRSWNTNVTEDHSWWVSNHEKITLQEFEFLKKKITNSIAGMEGLSEGQKLKQFFLLRCCIITVYPQNFSPFHFQNHQKNGTWHVTWVTNCDRLPSTKPPGPSKAYYNVYRDQGLRQASFRLIGQTLTPFFNDTDLDAGRAYGYQAPERGRWEVGVEDWMLGKFLGKQTIRIWINVWWKAVILWYFGLHSCFSGGIAIKRLQGWFCVFEESPS